MNTTGQLTSIVGTAILSVAAATTIIFSSFLFYFGASSFQIASFQTLIGFFKTLFMYYALISVLIYTIFSILTIYIAIVAYENRIVSIGIFNYKLRGFIKPLLSGLKIEQIDASIVAELNKKGLQALDKIWISAKNNWYLKSIISFSLSTLLFVGVYNFLKLLILLSILFIATFFLHFSEKRNEQFQSMARQDIYKMFLKYIPPYALILSIFIGYYRADFLTNYSKHVIVETEKSQIVAKSIGYTSDGMILYRDGSILYIPFDKIYSIRISSTAQKPLIDKIHE